MPLCLVTSQSVLVTAVAVGNVICLRDQFSLKTFDRTSCTVDGAAWGGPCNICRSTTLLLLVIYYWWMAHYKTLFDSKSYVNDFSILDGDESYWELWTGMQLISSDVWPAKFQCALVSESTDCLMLYSAVECCERKTFSNITVMKLTQGPLFLPAQVPDFILYQ